MHCMMLLRANYLRLRKRLSEPLASKGRNCKGRINKGRSIKNLMIWRGVFGSAMVGGTVSPLAVACHVFAENHVVYHVVIYSKT